MKRLLLAAALFSFSLLPAHAQMGEAEMKAMEAYGAVGDMHAMLARDNGAWQETVTMWSTPGAEPMTFKAEVQAKMVMDGRYQQQTHTGEMMGAPFNGLSTTGFDNARRVFVNTWIDNFGTSLMYSEGTWNAATKSIEFKGVVTDPMAGGKQVPFRQVLTFVSDGEQRVEMYMKHGGKEFKSMEIALRRN